MKNKFTFLLALFFAWFLSKAQVTPYTGGIGSGYSANQSAFFNCSLFTGGMASGAASNSTPLIACPLFFGDSADGHASNFSQFTICAMFFGDSADGHASAQTPSLPCPMFFGDSADGTATNFSALTICTHFFGGPGDGYATDSTGCQLVLPIRLLEFYGIKEETRNVLHWQLAAAQQAKLFEVERSRDGLQFNSIGSVPGSTSMNHLYTFIDNTPLPLVNYYRLKITERDLTISYSAIIVLRNEDVTQLSVYPNPAHTQAMVYCYVPEHINTGLSVYRQNGQMVTQRNIKLRRGGNYILLHTANIPNGGYFIRLHQIKKSATIIIQH
jgi:hypothetical protein